MTPNDSHTRCRLLAEEIAAIFKDGIILSKEARHYIDSTFSSPSCGELAGILDDASGCETQSLLEMIFFPDEAQQIRLEPILATYHFEGSDSRKVLSLLLTQGPETVLLFPESKDELRIKVPREAAARFIARLNIHKRIDARLRESLERHAGEALGARFKVGLRNTRFEFSENKVAFFKRFFESMKPESALAFDCFDFLLVFFDELKDDRHIYRGLMDKKRFYFKNLQKVLRAEAQLEKSNMETLILQGGRMFFFDKEAAGQNMRLIDEISLAVFKKTEPLDPLSAGIELLEKGAPDSLNKMFRTLS